MKKNIKTILVGLLIVLLIFYGCSNAFNKLLEPSKQNGSGASLRVQINNGSSARLIRPNTDALSYDVSLYIGDDSNPRASKTVNSSESIIFEYLEVGAEYRIVVVGKQDGKEFLEGEATFTAEPGVNTVNISLSFIKSDETGNGDLSVSYILNDASTNFDKLIIVAQLKSIDGVNPIPFGENECTYISDTQTIIIDKKGIPAGTYILSIKLKNSLNGTDFFLMIDPIVEIYPGLTSTHTETIELNNKNQTNAKFTYYVSNADDTEDNSGFSSDDPITLREALKRINLRYDITESQAATIMLMGSITVPFEGDFKALEVKKNVSITSSSDQELYTISFTGNCENLFKLGQESGDPITMTLHNVTIGNEEQYTSVSAKGLFTVKNASLVLQEGVVLQNNTALEEEIEGQIETYADAGAVVLGQGAKLYLEDGAIYSCEGKYAGAIYVGEGAELYYKTAEFDGNYATSYYNFGKNNIYIASYSLDDLFLWEDTQTYKNFNSYTALKENSTMLGIDNDETAMNYLFAGKGIAANPYKISSTEDIRAMSVSVPSTILAKEFEQTKNIVVDDDQTGIYHFQGIPEFSGTYDGAGFAITGLNIEPSYEKDNGFFRFLNGATVKNLYLDAKIYLSQQTVDDIYTYGLLAGYAQNSTITNCGTTGSLTVNPASEPESGKSLTVGGLIGYSKDNTITQCFSAAYLIAERFLYMGGLVGCLNGGSITNAYAASTNQAYVRTSLSSDFYIGSLVGYLNTESNKPTITNTYATLIPVFTGPSANYANVGYIGGSYNTNYTLTNSYQLFAPPVPESTSGIWVEEIVEDDFTKQSSYVLFDFEDIWTIDEGTSYPYFQLQNQKQDPAFFKPGLTP